MKKLAFLPVVIVALAGCAVGPNYKRPAVSAPTIAIENALAYRKISELKDKLAQEKVYLEEEFRSEMGFEQIW